MRYWGAPTQSVPPALWPDAAVANPTPEGLASTPITINATNYGSAFKYEKILNAAVMACAPLAPSRDLEISIDGNAGNEIGHSMRRGLIAIGGTSGDAVGGGPAAFPGLLESGGVQFRIRTRDRRR